MKLKHLESILSNVSGFNNPKWALEQYSTPPALAAKVIFTMHDLEAIEGCSILDLGCGTGMLLIGAMVMGADYGVGIDADGDALFLAKENLQTMDMVEDTMIDLIQGDVVHLLPFKPGKRRGWPPQLQRQGRSLKPLLYVLPYTQTLSIRS